MIKIHGAKVNNLKNISVDIPQGKLVVITGLSGSGKSSLAFDTLYAEGQRRYVESLSSYARQFLGRMAKPEVDLIENIAPAVAIEQKVNTSNPRSTVGTSTELYEYLKLMFARIGRTFSPISGVEVKRHSVSDVVDYVYSFKPDTKVTLYAPLAFSKEHPLRPQLEMLHQEGFVRIAVKGTIVRIEDWLASGADEEETLLLVDRIQVHPDDDDQHARIAESVQTAFFEGRGGCIVHCEVDGNTVEQSFSNRFEADGITFEKPNPNFFSFNNPYGACPTCQGYGTVMGIDENMVVPNKSRSVFDDAVVCWRGEKMCEWKNLFIRQAAKLDFPIHTPYCDLTQAQRDILWHGSGAWEGIDGFFKWLETQAYKIQYRVMLSRYKGKTTCPDCRGTRLRKDASYVKVCGRSITDLLQMPVSDFAEWLKDISSQPEANDGLHLTAHEHEVVGRLLTELHNRVGYLLDVGLGYLSLNRLSNTLSGGESQRINLATSLGSSLVGSMYILDEPSIGLHSRDTDRLIKVLKQLRDLGNTVIVVEHDEDIMRAADYIIDIGPGAGRMGGEVVFAGTPQQMVSQMPQQSLTAQYLLGKMEIAVPASRRPWRDRITVHGAYCNNLQHVDVDFPLGVLTVVTGVSGSGKTSLVRHVLCDVLQKRFEGAEDYVGNCVDITGDLSRISSLELVDQNPIGRSTRSNPATYMKAYDEIRQLYAQQPLAKARGYKPGYFSFNTEGGRCEVCEGEGYVTIGMQFMADVHLVCEECHGTRFKEETLEVLYNGKNISEVLDMTVNQAVEFFEGQQSILDRLKPLQDVGLGYLKLGQSSSSLSGGEAQRVKLASFLVRGEGGKPKLFVFDEPSTGLHFHDIQKLINSFNYLIERGHSIIVIEHHHDIIKVADWVIDMGPEGGRDGGRVVFAGTPEQLVQNQESYTARFLRDKLPQAAKQVQTTNKSKNKKA